MLLELLIVILCIILVFLQIVFVPYNCIIFFLKKNTIVKCHRIIELHPCCRYDCTAGTRVLVCMFLLFISQVQILIALLFLYEDFSRFVFKNELPVREGPLCAAEQEGASLLSPPQSVLDVANFISFRFEISWFLSIARGIVALVSTY